MQTVSLKTLAGFLPNLLAAKIVPFIKGSPALGKSAVARQVAQQLGLKMIDVRLAECDPTELSGFPYFDQQTKKASYFPLNTFPTENDPIPQGYNGWLIFLDEFSNAPMSVQAAAYRLVLDRQVGQHNLHKNVAIIAAGNLETDNAAAMPMSTALVSRFAIFEVEINKDDWIEWATGAGIDYRITSYINFRPDHLYNFIPSAAEQPYASPRTWEMLDRVLKKTPDFNKQHSPILNALIGEGVASEYLTFLELQKELPTFQQVIDNPENVKLGDDLSIRWALMGMVSHNVTESSLEAVIKFIKRFSDDLQVVAMREIIQRHPDLKAKSAFNQWINELSKVFK